MEILEYKEKAFAGCLSSHSKIYAGYQNERVNQGIERPSILLARLIERVEVAAQGLGR